jgi:hypothetical protein
LESKVVLHDQSPPGAAEAQWEIAEASTLVERGANDVGGYSTT